MDRENFFWVFGNRIQRGKYSIKQPLKFDANRDAYFAEQLVERGSHCVFYETANFGFLQWEDPKGKKHLARE